MERKITVPIFGNVYRFPVKSPDEEEAIRKEAKAISQMAADLHMKFPGKTETEIGRIVALNEGLKVVKLQKEIESLRKEIEGMGKELKSYLEKIV